MQQFSEKARQVLAAANTTATAMHHPTVEVSHLLLAMLEVPDSAAHKLLIAMRLRPELVREHLALKPTAADTSLALSPDIKRVIQFAVDASKRWRHTYIGTEHLLLALARHNAPITRQILDTANTDGDRIRQRIESMFEAGILTEQPSTKGRTPQQYEVDDAIKQIIAQVVAGLEPEDWKALGRISKRITISMYNVAGLYMQLLTRQKPGAVVVKVLEELLKRAATEPDPHFLDPKSDTEP